MTQRTDGMADPGGLKLSAAVSCLDALRSSHSMVSGCCLHFLHVSFFFQSSENSRAVFSKKAFDSYPLQPVLTWFPCCLCTFSTSTAPLFLWISLGPKYQRAGAGWGLLSRATSLLIPSFERVLANRKLHWKHAKSLSHKGSRETQNNLFQQYQLKTICSACLWPLMELREKTFVQFKVLKEYFSFFPKIAHNIRFRLWLF